MLLHLPEVIAQDRVRALRDALTASLHNPGWEDGRRTSGPQAGQVKRNLQLPSEHPLAHQAGEEIRAALQRHPLLQAAALPRAILPMLFNACQDGGHYGPHVDNAVQFDAAAGQVVRRDLSVTVFLTPLEDYDGGELEIADAFGTHDVRLPAGDAILYPATSLHQVLPVERGTRLAAVTWIQSLIPDGAARAILFDLDCSVIRLRACSGDTPEVHSLTGVYHRLMQRWARP